MYSNDTFFHLSTFGQIGLAMLSLVLACVTLWVFHKSSSRFGLFVKLLMAIVFLWLFVWLSPQIYYLYYLTLFDGLPFQWVIGAPATPKMILETVFFANKATLSDHAKGALFWLMVSVAAWSHYTKRP